MRFEVELARGPTVFDHLVQKEVPLRTHYAILAAVAGSVGPLRREDLIALVWPGTPISTARNRLRVALANLRQRMPDALAESPAGLQLNPDVVRVDVLDIAAQIRAAEDTVTAESEFEALQGSLSRLGDGVVWASFRSVAGALYPRIAAAAIRLFELARLRNDRSAALDAARLAASLTPEVESSWEAFLRASLEAGQAEESLSWFRRYALPDIQQSNAIQDLLRAVRNPIESPAECFTSEEAALLLSILQRTEATRLDLWRALLSASEARVLAGRHPRTMHDLLHRAVPLGSETRDAVWELSAARLCGLKAWLGDASGVLQLAPEVLESSQDPIILRAVWNTVAIAHSINRAWDLAHKALDQTAEFAKLTGNAIDEIATEGNRAFFFMHQARYEDAEKAYRQQDEQLQILEAEQARFERAIAEGYRALIPVYQQDWAEAQTRLQRAIEVRSGKDMSLQMGLLQTALALAVSHLGRVDEALPLLRAGFVDAFNADSVLTQQATFEFAAGTLTRTPMHTYGTAVLDWVAAWRDRTGTPRSQAESELALSLTRRRSARELQIDPHALPSAVGREIMRRLRQQVQSLRP